jgi:hypothetical protein
MTHVEVGGFPNGTPLEAGFAYEPINRFFGLLGKTRSSECLDVDESFACSQRSPQEGCLVLIQDAISDVSMHLPQGFASGLNRQFANLMDEDAWEEEDELIGSDALNTFLQMILRTRTNRRPGIGSNGLGSITASWRAGGNRLIVECLPTGDTSLLLTRIGDDEKTERAVFKSIRPDRLLAVLAPFCPEVWFDH